MLQGESYFAENTQSGLFLASAVYSRATHCTEADGQGRSLPDLQFPQLISPERSGEEQVRKQNNARCPKEGAYRDFRWSSPLSLAPCGISPRPAPPPPRTPASVSRLSLQLVALTSPAFTARLTAEFLAVCLSAAT
jgi:hypothetical protein